MNWKDERNTVLNWWPQLLAGSRHTGHMFVDSLEDAAWGCTSEQDWNNWLEQLNKIWSPHDTKSWASISPLEQNNDQNIDVHLGATLAQALHNKIYHQSQLRLSTQAASPPHRSVHPASVRDAAQKLLHDFALKEIVTSRSSSSAWINKQLVDAHLGLANMATILGLKHERIGQGKLRLWIHEKSPYTGATNGDSDHIEIHKNGGNVAQAWGLWRLEIAARHPLFDTSYLAHEWRRGWRGGWRMGLEHQQQFVIKSQQSFKLLLDQIPVTSDMGQKVFRRYRAVCKWMDDVNRGASREHIQQSWIKIKTGNRIAWSGCEEQFASFIKKWTWEERLIETAFWVDPQWHIPSWVQRRQAMLHGEWVRSGSILEDEEYHDLWAMGFSGIVHQRLGYDGWMAQQHVCHPQNRENVDFLSFFNDHLHQVML